MRVDFVWVLVALAVCGLAALTPWASASVTEHCGSVSYTFPGTDDHGHAALNNLTATNVACAKARSVAKTFLITHKPPKDWHASSRTVLTKGFTVGEEIFTQGKARIVGDLAN
jgi:hypothetical protein